MNGEGPAKTTPQTLFEVSIYLAKFAGVSIFELRREPAEEVLYLYRSLEHFEPEGESPAKHAGTARRQVFADQVDWFD